MSYDTKEKRVLSCDTKENMDSTDSALDEVVSWFLHERLYVQDFQEVLDFFSLIIQFYLLNNTV